MIVNNVWRECIEKILLPHNIIIAYIIKSSYIESYLIRIFSCYIFYSMLDVLAGRKNPSGLSGTVLVNGERQPRNFKQIAGYVVQVKRLFNNKCSLE